MAGNRAANFFWTVWSFIRHGDMPIREFDRRLEICVTCEFVKFDPPPPEAPTGIFCKACGCPDWWMSDQRMKARMRDAACPKNKW